MVGMVCSIALAAPGRFDTREKDWRNGAVVYQVFVDRFARGAGSAERAKVIQAPRVQKSWQELPVPGHKLEGQGVWSHELEFWGGDIHGVQSKLDYIKSVGADVVYLTPIFEAFTNHKYDTSDYRKIDPAFGTQADLKALTVATHSKKMKIVLDGVFNHIGRHSPLFSQALANPKSAKRDWFLIGDQYPGNYAAYAGVANLPEWNLENPAVRRELWTGSDSIVKHYLKQGIDGWRLDVAFELGVPFLTELTGSAHSAKSGSLVVAEISGYPAGWFPAVDGVFDFTGPAIGIAALNGQVSGGRASRMLAQLVEDAGIENLLKSWILTDNHDTQRLATVVPSQSQRHLVQAMQFTLPGSPVVYYGTELGMAGGGDPACRAPMRWDLVSKSQPDLAWVKKLCSARKQVRSLRIGDYLALETEALIGYVRVTDKVKETAIVLVNPTGKSVKELVSCRDGRILSWGECADILGGGSVRAINGLIQAEVPAYGVQILVPKVDSRVYRRIQ